MVTGAPATTRYHRWLGWHAPALRRAVNVAVIGLAVTLALWPFVPWELAAIGGWDAAALIFLVTVWPIILRADTTEVERLAIREDETRATATTLLLGASIASLTGVGFALSLAGQQAGARRVVLVGFALLTVMLSWTVVNTVFTLRYADRYFGSGPNGILFGGENGSEPPDYRDFAYVAFTIGMTYQVSDTTLRDRRIRRTALAHALLSYLFGVVIVAGAINLVAGLVR